MKIRFGFCIGVILVAVLDSVENLENEETANLNQTFFISEIFHKYGNNNIMTYEGFEHLLENLGLGKLKFETKHDVSIHKVNGTFIEFHDELSLHKHQHSGGDSPKKPPQEGERSRRKRNLKSGENAEKSLTRKCLTAQDILKTYGLKPYHEVVISPSKYLQMCPAIVYELDEKLCQEEDTGRTKKNEEERYLVWIYASVSILVMGISGMLCILVVPLVGKADYSCLLQFLVFLAVGTLCGDALIHLIPQIFSTNRNRSSETMVISRGAVVLLAIYFFFVVENILKGIRKKKKKNVENNKESGAMLPPIEGHGHYHDQGSADIKTIAWMAIMGDILHNVTDGLSIGAAFSLRISSGFASSIAIFCHELPHELEFQIHLNLSTSRDVGYRFTLILRTAAVLSFLLNVAMTVQMSSDYAILLASGMSVKKSLFYNIISSIFSFIGMIGGVLLGEIEDASLWINAFTAGSFLYIALSDLVPEMKIIQQTSSYKSFIIQTMGLFSGGILMFTIALYEDQLESLLS